MEESELPQSKIGSEEPIFASPLLKAGAKIAPHRGARAIGPPFHISRVNNNLSFLFFFYMYKRKKTLFFTKKCVKIYGEILCGLCAFLQ